LIVHRPVAGFARYKADIRLWVQSGEADMTTNSATLNKSDQLVAMLKKPNGTRVSLIGEKLDWQAHTVRAAISGLRRKGFEVSRTNAKKSGEAVYAIVGGRSSGSPQTLNFEPTAETT
jgi:biotin operon repressor